MADYITTAHTALKNRNDIFKKKADGTLNGIIHLVSINIAFSANGLAKVSPRKISIGDTNAHSKQLGAEKFNDNVFNGGQFKDMTAPSEGQTAEDHQGLDDQLDWVTEFKPSSGGIDGVVWPNHYADIILKHPAKRFKEGATIKCRVRLPICYS